MASKEHSHEKTVVNEKVLEKRSKLYTGWNRSCLVIFLALSLVIGIVLGLLPSPIDPVVINFGETKSSSFAGSNDLREAVRLFDGKLVGPEGFAIDGDGYIYTGLHDGRIVKFKDGDDSFSEVTRLGPPPYDSCGTGIEDTESHCGRVLGLEMSPVDAYFMYICDPYYGISTLSLKTGEKSILVNISKTYPHIPPIKFANDIVVLKNGSVYFTDSSYKFTRTDFMLEIFEGRPNGKLLHYNPVDKTLYVVHTQLYFANGISVNKDESFLVIAETSQARILKYYLKGAKVGQIEVFTNQMSGLPDNISPSASGGFWVGFGAVKTTLAITLSKYPGIRNLMAKLQIHRMIAKLVPRSGLIVEYDENGNILRELYDEGGQRIKSVSEILDLGDVLYLGSYDQPFIGKLKTNINYNMER